MELKLRRIAEVLSRQSKSKIMLGGLSLTILVSPISAIGQTGSESQETPAQLESKEEIVVTGIRASLESALAEKRNSDNLIEVIEAVDIGKLPDQNLAEVLENITGIQITRTSGVGTGVQIRGTDANRVEFNGVSTIGSSGERSGIDFEDVNASIISSVEVIKSPEAKTIEGSVGGTVNLKTIRPLDLKETLGSIRIQGEDSSLSEESIQPRISGSFGDVWDTSIGRVGLVISGSYTEQEAVSFRPRADADNLFTTSNIDVTSPGVIASAEILGTTPAGVVAQTPDEFLGVQFLTQEQENDSFETTNISATLQWAPNDNLTFGLDYILNDQERSRRQYRLQASGVSGSLDTNIPLDFESVDFGNVLFPDADDLDVVGNLAIGVVPSDLTSGPGGEFFRATRGLIIPSLADDPDDPNLRSQTETNSRFTKSEIIVLGGEWQDDRWTIGAELALTDSDTTEPTLNTTLNFLNPNCVGGIGASNDNCVPFIYDLNDGLSFDVLTVDRVADLNEEFGLNLDPAALSAPTDADFSNPANYALEALEESNDSTNNSEDAFRLDFSYNFADTGITSVDFGYRYSKTEASFTSFSDSFGLGALADSPLASEFSGVVVEGADNFGSADGRELFIDTFLQVDPDASQSEILAALDAAGAQITEPEVDPLNSYEAEETTDSLYAQLNFESGIFRGNFGVRYVDTDFTQTSASGFNPVTGVNFLETTSNSYDFLLPRINLAAQVTEDVVIRFGFGSDIRRPDFDDLTTALDFDDSENAVVEFGNPDLIPEEVDSLDLAVEWYFAPQAVASIGYFRKERTDVFGTFTDGAALSPSTVATSGFERETDPLCPGGGIFNAEIEPNVLGDPNVNGLCADRTEPSNDSGTTTQTGFELAFQYDLSHHEEALGWASGFGVIANYTTQRFSGGEILDVTSGRGQNVIGLAALPRGLLDFSEEAYNITLYYEKYGLSARARYTWRDEFRTTDFGGGANESGSSTFSFPVITEDRGQLNLSINYDVPDQFNIGVEVVNATEEGIVQRCVSSSGPVCFEGLPDRRITFGGSYRF